MLFLAVATAAGMLVATTLLGPKKKFADKIVKDKPQKFTCLDAAFKDNDQLKTNTALQIESSKVQFKVI